MEDFFREYEERHALESVSVGGVELRKGSRVLLWPRSGADIMDLALKGKVAFVEGLEQDYEERIYIAVTLEDDPGRDLGEDRFLGHRFFFSPEEVEPLDFEVTEVTAVTGAEYAALMARSSPQPGAEPTEASLALLQAISTGIAVLALATGGEAFRDRAEQVLTQLLTGPLNEQQRTGTGITHRSTDVREAPA